MKRIVALTLVALFILGTTAFGQGIRIEKKVEKKKVEAPAPEVIEEEIEIELEDLTVPGCPSCEAKKKAGAKAGKGCDGCKGDGGCGKEAPRMTRAVAVSGEWNKLPPEVKAKILKDLRAGNDDETFRKILKSLVSGDKGATIGADGVGLGGAKGGGVTIIQSPPAVKGKRVVAKPGEHMIVVEGDPKVQVRGRIVTKDGSQPHGMMTGGGAPTLGRMFVMRGNDSGPAGCPHCAPKAAPRCGCQDHARPPAPKCGCQGCSPRPAPRCGCQGQTHGGRPHPFPQPPRHAGFDDGLRHSLDALRGEISGLRHELRAMHAMHQASMKKAAMGKAAGSFKMSGVAPGAYRVAVKHPPAPPKPGVPPKAVVVGKSAAGTAWGTPKKYYTTTKSGGFSFGVVPAKPDPRQKKLEAEVASLKKEMGHMKAMMHEMLKKLDEMQKQNKK